MRLIDFEAITKLFSGSDAIANQKQLFDAVLLMVLRATIALSKLAIAGVACCGSFDWTSY